MVISAVAWYFWLGIPLAAAAVLLVLATIAGYVKTVSAQRYPKNR